MMFSTNSLSGLFLSVTLALSTVAVGQSRASGFEDFSQPAAEEWPMVGGDWNNTRYSKLTQINAQNVSHLGAAWVSATFEDGGRSRVTPVVKGGRMFVTAGRRVYALSAKTGEKVWSYNTAPDATQTPGYPSAVPNSRGVGVGGGLVFVGLKDGNVIALNEKTGDLVWRQQTGVDQPKKGQWAAVAPTYANGVVYTGLSNGEDHLRGRVTALDARTGRQLWHFYSIPGPGEPGHETWPSFNDAWKIGGGGVWTNSPVDPELGTVYATAGNPVPPYAGDWRPGANLYTSSVLALDIESGKLKWYYQLVHHDVFEGDAGTPVILYEAHVAGRVRRALAVLRADGYLFQLDRETGKPLFRVEERPVPQLRSQRTWPTQPFPVVGDSILMSCEDWRKEGIPSGFALGCMWTPPAFPPPSKDPPNVLAPFPGARLNPMAYSPQTGYFYAQSVSSLFWPRRAQDPYFFDGGNPVLNLKAFVELAAIDSRTGRIAWRKRMPVALVSGGPMVTAGRLMFRSSGDGNVEAYDAQSGDVLWQFQTGMAGGLASPASYAVDGEQYVAVPMGPAVWAFKLGGMVPQGRTPTLSSRQEKFSGPTVDSVEIETTSLHRAWLKAGMRYFTDEYTFNPYRARVRVGAKVLFVNNGNMGHEVVALDGSWGTGRLSPAEQAWVTFSKPGEYTYICKDHPWSYGQLVVVADPPIPDQATDSTGVARSNLRNFSEQAMSGKEQFKKHCSACHGEDLAGRGAAPALFGHTFMLHWDNATVSDLFDRIRTTMPEARPGTLDSRTYLDIVVYLLEVNHVMSDTNHTSDDVSALMKMKMQTSP